MSNRSADGFNNTPNFKISWANESILTNVSLDEWYNTTSVRPITSKYERILQALSQQNSVNNSEVYEANGLQNQTKNGNIKQSQKMTALILPMVLLGVFLAFVAFCHRVDTIRNRRKLARQKKKSIKTPRNSETEQAVEEVDQEADVVLLRDRHKEIIQNLGQHNPLMCEDDGQHAFGRCMCKLERCAHCLGFEAKKLQWKDLVYNADAKVMNTFDLKNASTQTWMPVHNKFRALPQSSHKDGSLSQKPACINRHYVVEADSVFDSEVSSKPHFPSSASNYTDSKTSDFLSSIREVSGSFYYSATSANNNSEFHEMCSAGPSEDTKSKRRSQKQKGLKKQYVSEAQLLSDEEDWI